MRRPIPSQGVRAAWALGYGLALIALNLRVTGSWLPPATGEGLWFYTAAVSLILGDLIVHPYFARPKDALALSLASGIAVWFVSRQQAADASLPTVVALWFCLVVAGLAALTMIIGRVQRPRLKVFGRIAKELSTTVGHPKVVLTAVFVVALVEFHIHSPKETVLVVLTWAVLIGVQPERPLYWLWQRIGPGHSKTTDLGGIAAYRTPGLFLVRHESGAKVELGTYLVCRDSSGPVYFAIALNHTGREPEALLLRCLEVTVPDSHKSWLEEAAKGLGPDRVGTLDKSEVPAGIATEIPILRRLDRFLGIVDERTDIQTLYFEVIEPRDVAEGHLIQVPIRGEGVIYQVTNGVTREEVIYQRHTHGYARAEATKIGTWVSEKKRFERAPWLPQLNSPVTQVDPIRKSVDAGTVGHFPGSEYPVEIADVHDLVTHNTAILGILGIGKSMLAIELVERMLAANVKVLCLDLTEQYASELEAWHDRNLDNESTKKIVEAGEQDRDAFSNHPEQGGSFPKLKEVLADELQHFMQSDDRPLMILNPARFGATRQENEPRSYSDGGNWKRSAPLWSVTSVQVTQVVAETLLALVQDDMRDEARVCLVLEEAHSLVPEWNNVSNDADRNATNGTARAILQGRKYGFGCLLVTQRTANVTKTILNQCNTIFAMRTFDDTGKAFLSNYLGSDYADMLPTLGEREAVFFGKASNCENPIRVRLNDRQDFLKRFREANPPQSVRGAAGGPTDELARDEGCSPEGSE